MPRAKLTAKFIENVKPPAEGQVDYFDATLPAFGIRVTRDGTKSWFVFYRVDGKQIRQTIGRHPHLTLAAAREKAAGIHDMLDQGKDPRLEVERQRRQEARARAGTFGAVAPDFKRLH